MRIENAKQFLKENLIEIIACAARIYDLIEITLYSSIKRQKMKLKRRLFQDVKNIIRYCRKMRQMLFMISSNLY
jgi:hypothetical protein